MIETTLSMIRNEKGYKGVHGGSSLPLDQLNSWFPGGFQAQTGGKPPPPGLNTALNGYKLLSNSKWRRHASYKQALFSNKMQFL